MFGKSILYDEWLVSRHVQQNIFLRNFYHVRDHYTTSDFYGH